MAITPHSLPRLGESGRHGQPDAAPGEGKDHARMTRIPYCLSQVFLETLRNSSYPAKVLETEHGVTCTIVLTWSCRSFAFV